MDSDAKKIVLYFIGIVCIMPILIAAVRFLPFAMHGLSHTPRPAITYGEFPFRLEYEINGEIVVVEDTVICEFDGFEVNAQGKYRKWKQCLASGESNVVLLVIDATKRICYPVRDAAYYMGDRKGSFVEPPIAYVSDGMKEHAIYPHEELFITFGIRLISWEFSPPIVNTFK